MLLLCVRVAAAEPAALRLDCPRLSDEQTAEVETRARAALLTAGIEPAELELGCDAEHARATLRAHADLVDTVIPLETGDVPDQLMRALDAAIDQLSQHSETKPETLPPSRQAFELGESAPAAPSEPQLATRPPAEQPPRAIAPGPTPSFRGATISAGGVLETWGSRLAPGAALRARFGGERLGVTWSASYQVSPAQAFRADELGIALGIDFHTPHAPGLMLEGDLGFSLLSVTPSSPYRPLGATSVSAGFARLLLARPIVVGRLAIVPAIGARVFTAPRRLRLDGEERLKLGYVAPHAALSICYRLE